MSTPGKLPGQLIAEGIVAGYSATDMILKGVTIRVEPGEIVAIIGPNGAGKSTLFKVVAGILHPSEGRVALDGAEIHGLDARAIAARGVAFVPQEQNIFASLSVHENLEMGGYMEPARARERIESIFVRFPELAERRRQQARTLSGGQRQILAMATALMVEPKLLLLDEPSAGLSPMAAERLFETILGINRDAVSIAMVEQNALEALNISARGYILVDGRNSREGKAADLAADPEVRRIFLGG
jgi:branched-chain amino acid transport system ATP-binding protein/neutral amino acid transport system ATP-binding protein